MASSFCTSLNKLIFLINKLINKYLLIDKLNKLIKQIIEFVKFYNYNIKTNQDFTCTEFPV